MAKSPEREQAAQQTHESLVNALESIKSLLEQSETKLSAARESIAKASQPRDPFKSLTSQQDFDIPVLDDDDIVIPGAELSSIADTINETLAKVSEAPLLPAEPARQDPQQVLDYLDTLQQQLEKSMRDSLMKSVVSIETGLKKVLKEELDKLRAQVKKDLG